MKRLFKRLQHLAAILRVRRPFAGRLSARLFLSLLLLLCCASGLRGQEYLHRLETAIDMGTYNGPFTYRDSVDTSDYTDDFLYPGEEWFEASDVFYRLTLSSSVELDMWHSTSSAFAESASAYLLDAQGEVQKYIYLRESPGWTSVQLMPGTYYLVVQLKPSYPVPSGDPDGPIGFYVEGKPRATGEDFFYPADLGAFSEDFSRSVDMEHFTDFELDYRLTGDYDIDAFRHDVVHRFTLSEPMEVTLDNCGSGHGLGNPYNYQRSVVLSSSLDTVPPASTKSGCYYPDGIKEYVLSPGTYYVYSWGEYLSMDYNFTVNLAGTVIEEGSSPLRPADAGNRDADFVYSDTLAFSPGYWLLTLSVPMELEMTGGAGLAVRTESG